MYTIRHSIPSNATVAPAEMQRARTLMERKQMLEDLLLKHLKPEAYYEIKRYVGQRRKCRENRLKTVIDTVRALPETQHLAFVAEYRPKHFFSIYRKMQRTGKSLEQIQDLLGLRFICSDRETCYSLSGILQDRWTADQERFKDYIRHPKENGYRSIHLTLIAECGRPIEVQIRSFGMHIVAETGSAAHGSYKENGGTRWNRTIVSLEYRPTTVGKSSSRFLRQ